MVHFTKIQLSSELLYSVQTPESAMDELSQMLNGKGVYGIPLRTLPSLRFLAFITLCPDCDTHSSTANANAANVGSKGKLTKEAALTCTLTLRKTCETQLLKCRAHSREAEKKFEKGWSAMAKKMYQDPTSRKGCRRQKLRKGVFISYLVAK